MTTILVALAIGIPALAFTLWPAFRRRAGGGGFLPVPEDPRAALLERKQAALRALRELEFEHQGGHLSDEDHAELFARYEAEAASALTALDALGATPPPAPGPAARSTSPARSAWRHPAALATGASVLVLFGVAIGAGIVRHTAPDPMGAPAPGSRPLAPPLGGPAAGPVGGGGETPRTLAPQMLQGMLQAARASLFEGRYGEAIAAYQAVLKREPRNVDAVTHLGLIVAIGGHADAALEAFDKALAIDPNYPPALLYRGQVLLEARKDVDGAIAAWEKFRTVAPAGEDRERVGRMIEEAKAARAK